MTFHSGPGTTDHGLQTLRVGRGNAGDFLATANERIHGTATDASSSAAPPGGSGGLLRMGRGSACALRLRGCRGGGIVELFRPPRANRKAAPSGFRRKVRARAEDSGSMMWVVVVLAACWVVEGGWRWLSLASHSNPISVGSIATGDRPDSGVQFPSMPATGQLRATESP